LKSTGRKLNELTDTPLAHEFLSNEEKRQASADCHPLKRIGTPQEIARLALYLLSDASAWLTGQIFHLDGGMSTLKTIQIKIKSTGRIIHLSDSRVRSSNSLRCSQVVSGDVIDLFKQTKEGAPCIVSVYAVTL